MSEKEMVCRRSACRRPLTRGYWKVWNDSSTTEPNHYCPKCGRNIVEGGRAAGFNFEKEIVLPPRNTLTKPLATATEGVVSE